MFHFGTKDLLGVGFLPVRPLMKDFTSFNMLNDRLSTKGVHSEIAVRKLAIERVDRLEVAAM
jgi:hypothetical protein